LTSPPDKLCSNSRSLRYANSHHIPDGTTGLIQTLQHSLTAEEINILLDRKQGLKEYEEHMRLSDWSEVQWQDFFEREQWVFGYGLDYRMMRQFDREMTVGVEAPTTRTGLLSTSL